MAPQFLKKLAATAAMLSLGVGMHAFAQPTATTDKSGGPTPSTDKSGGPTPSTSKSGGPTPSTSKSGGPTPATGNANAKSSLDAGERKFVETAAHDGMAEVMMGQLAQQKGQSQAVKDFGSRMVTDHGKANDELKTLAASKGITLPASTDKSHMKDHEKMSKLSGDKFDKEYCEHMTKEHKKDVKEFEKQAKNAKDADVRAFAAKTLPVLQEHLKMAQQMEETVKKSGKGGSGK
jgi:putative membrane protein